MNTVPTIIIAAVSFVFGALLVWVWCARALAQIQAKIPPLETEILGLRPLKTELDAARAAAGEAERSLAGATARVENIVALEAELATARQRVNDLTAEVASITARHDAASQAHKEQIEQLTSLRQDVQNQFKLLAADVLKNSNADFEKRATEIFDIQKESAKRDISDLVKPLGETLRAYETALGEIEKARIAGYGELGATLKALTDQNAEVRNVTSNLVNALRASPKTRGRWGEETLRRVMELCGMVENCDFETEKHFGGGEESLRPDVVISITGGRTIIVDAKAPVTAYLEAIEAGTEEAKDLLLSRHAKQLRERLTDLSSKNYRQKIMGTADCVVMFVPGDNFVSAAFERDPDLFEDGIKNKVLICTPTTFIALAKAISYGWRQEKLAQSAEEVSKLGQELYARLITLGGHIAGLGKNITGAAQKYNLMIGSLENSVLPQARKFNELGVPGTSDALPELVQVDTLTRFPAQGRDLLLPARAEPEAS